MKEDYEKYLAGFCAYSHALIDLKHRIESGEVVPEEKVGSLLRALSVSKEKLLEAKQSLGYDDALSFLEDNNFAGFSVKNGEVIGDKTKLFLITKPWMERPANNYQHEVAVYLVASTLRNDYLSEERVGLKELISKPVKKKGRKPLFEKIRSYLHSLKWNQRKVSCCSEA